MWPCKRELHYARCAINTTTTDLRRKTLMLA
jgi:hypothetical protein